MATLIASADQIQAVLQLVQRAPLTLAEKLFIEALFTQWFTELKTADQPRATSGEASAADVLPPGTPDMSPADRTLDQANAAIPAGVPSTKGSDLAQSP